MPASSSGVQTVGIGQHERASSFCIVEPAGRKVGRAVSAFRDFGFVGGSWITKVVIARLEPFSTIHRVGYHVIVPTGVDTALAMTILVTSSRRQRLVEGIQSMRGVPALSLIHI